jgi:hypothetical protein
MNMLLARIAATVPGPVEFQIHQVVAEFQTSIATKHQPRKLSLLRLRSRRKNSGIKARKIRNVTGRGGHAAASNNPDDRDNIAGCSFFKQTDF